ncbi:MAG TPA: alpha-L-rhamnosidase C-terminal domain-containing protein, partial [Lacunisphaera sp.]
FAALAENIRNGFEKRFYQPASFTYGGGRQTTSILPLAFNLAPAANRAAIANALRQRIEGHDRKHLDTGIFGTRYLFEVLIDHGFTDLAYQVLTAPGYPGFVDQINQGATTTWEQWSFRGSMQTHNHAMFAGADATFFSHFGGIRAAVPGFREIEIQPAYSTGLSSVDCSRETPLGQVASHWSRQADHLTLTVHIPVGATARIHLPVSTGTILESGGPLEKAAGVLAVTTEQGHPVVTVGSGTYEFTAPLIKNP